MPSPLDLAIDATINRLMTNDGPLTVTYVEKFGVQLPMLAKAPGNMADYFAFFCATHADKEFLVDGDIRLSFRQHRSRTGHIAPFGKIRGAGVWAAPC